MVCLLMLSSFVFFFFNDTATTEIYTLSLHDALPICEAVTDEARKPGPVTYLFEPEAKDRKSTRLNSSHVSISYAVFCLKKKKNKVSCIGDIKLHEPDQNNCITTIHF